MFVKSDRHLTRSAPERVNSDHKSHLGSGARARPLDLGHDAIRDLAGIAADSGAARSVGLVAALECLLFIRDMKSAT